MTCVQLSVIRVFAKAGRARSPTVNAAPRFKNCWLKKTLSNILAVTSSKRRSCWYRLQCAIFFRDSATFVAQNWVWILFYVSSMPPVRLWPVHVFMRSLSDPVAVRYRCIAVFPCQAGRKSLRLIKERWRKSDEKIIDSKVRSQNAGNTCLFFLDDPHSHASPLETGSSQGRTVLRGVVVARPSSFRPLQSSRFAPLFLRFSRKIRSFILVRPSRTSLCRGQIINFEEKMVMISGTFKFSRPS
jgi:hypothetical protein